MRHAINHEKSEDNNSQSVLSIMKKVSDSRRSVLGIPIVDRAVTKVVKSAKKKVKTHFGFELSLTEDRNAYAIKKANDWILKFKPELEKKLVDYEGTNLLLNSSYFIKLQDRTYAIIRIGSEFRQNVQDSEDLSALLSNTKIQDSDIYIYIFGKGAYFHKHNLEKLILDKGVELRMYKVYGEKNTNAEVAFRSLYQALPRRDMSTLFLENKANVEIEEHIEAYLKNRDLYTGRGIIYKTGILLYGEPGTGKTSLIKALACKYGYDLILIDMSTFRSIALDTLVHSINIDDRKYIIALEDVDCIMANRENELDKEEKSIVNKLLQFLDSSSSPNEVIFIASTNHKERLDEALLREGRFDLKVNIGGLREAKAREMCRSFDLSEKDIDDVILEIKAEGIDLNTTTIRQSKLQQKILKNSGMSIRNEVTDEDE